MSDIETKGVRKCVVGGVDIAEGHSKLEAIRCLKRYIAREVYGIIQSRNLTINQSTIST